MNDLRSAHELKLLADPTRARIMAMILDSPEGKQQVGRMAEQLQLSQPTVSHHVKALFYEGLLQRTPLGRNVWYTITPDQADRVVDLLRESTPTATPDGVLDRIATDLAGRFAGKFSPETVDRYVRESHALLLEQAHITRYLPSLTSRFAADRLSALGAVELRELVHIPEVLFVCVQNAGRSQLAAGILRHLAGDRISVRTAGSAPAAAVRSVIVTALDEIGVPVAGEYPKPLTDEVVRAADVVITMGCGDACPIYPGRQYLDWDLADPADLPLAQVRQIRDDIEARVRELVATLGVNAA